jgi:hypothetical protein
VHELKCRLGSDSIVEKADGRASLSLFRTVGYSWAASFGCDGGMEGGEIAVNTNPYRCN